MSVDSDRKVYDGVRRCGWKVTFGARMVLRKCQIVPEIRWMVDGVRNMSDGVRNVSDDVRKLS